MIYTESKIKDAAFNLAAEEYIMRCLPKEQTEKPVFMLWQTEKCVVIGRSQIAAAEVDLNAAHSAGFNIRRRSSGGGAIFSDSGNIMYSLITRFYDGDDPKKIEREQAAGFVAKALNKMGIPAISEGRNDITVNGKKISGLAQYAVKNRLCTHGSLLYNTDLELLTKILKTDTEKVSSKSIKSIRSRVVNLCEYFDDNLSLTEFTERLKSCLLDKTGKTEVEYYNFTEYDTEQINIIKAEKYDNPEWINGVTPKFSFHSAKRFPAGKTEIFMDVEHGIIKSCKIYGDFLGVLPIDELEKQLLNQPHIFGILSEILSKIDLRIYLGEIKREELLECLF